MDALGVAGLIVGIFGLIVGVGGLIHGIRQGHRADLQAKENEHLRNTFRGIMAGLYAPTTRAVHWASDMRNQTASFTKNPSPGTAEIARLMCLQSGRMEMHVNGQVAMIAKFSQEYLGLDLPRWRELIQEFEENRNSRAVTQGEAETQ